MDRWEGEMKQHTQKDRQWGDSSVRDVATCHHFSLLLLEKHHQSLGGSMTRCIIITHTDAHAHKHKAYFKV